jgi:glycerophosphoryl diester phosphodiesterase
MIWDLSLAELRELDAGYNFTRDGRSFPFRDRGVRVPTLDEVVALSGDARINLEIKQTQPSMLGALWRRIEALGVTDRVLVASADARLIRGFRNLARGAVATSAGRAEVFAFWLAVRAGLDALPSIEFDALQVPVRAGALEVVTREFVSAAHRRGVHVHVWTIDDAAQMRELIELGVDGIMTDEPARLAALARELDVLGRVGGRDGVGREHVEALEVEAEARDERDQVVDDEA